MGVLKYTIFGLLSIFYFDKYAFGAHALFDHTKSTNIVFWHHKLSSSCQSTLHPQYLTHYTPTWGNRSLQVSSSNKTPTNIVTIYVVLNRNHGKQIWFINTGNDGMSNSNKEEENTEPCKSVVASKVQLTWSQCIYYWTAVVENESGA